MRGDRCERLFFFEVLDAVLKQLDGAFRAVRTGDAELFASHFVVGHEELADLIDEGLIDLSDRRDLLVSIGVDGDG